MAVHRKIIFEKPSDHEMSFSRIFAAPCALAWRACMDPKQLAKWWGPNGFTLTTHSMEFKKGGAWKYTMHGPGGRDYKNTVVYTDIVENKRIVMKHSNDDGDETVSHENKIIFMAIDNNHTQINMTLKFKNAAAMKYVIDNYEADKGGMQTFGRLADFVEKK